MKPKEGSHRGTDNRSVVSNPDRSQRGSGRCRQPGRPRLAQPLIMNSYLLELLAKERAESWQRQGQTASGLKASRSRASNPARRIPYRFSFDGGRKATSLVDCR